MLKSLLSLLFTGWFLLPSASGQDKQGSVDELIELSGTLQGVRQVVTQMVDYQRTGNHNLPGYFWDSLTQEAQRKATQQLTPAIRSAYQEVYTEREIANLVTLYRSEAGQLMLSKQPVIAEKLQLPLTQWSRDIEQYIIEQLKDTDNVVPRTEETQQFKERFEQERGWEILRSGEGLPDQRNEGNILIDFGRPSGQEDITKVIVLRNATDSTMFLEPPPPTVPPQEITYSWSTKPVAPDDTTVIRVTFNAAQAEGNGYRSRGIRVGDDNYIPISVKFDAPYKSIKYETDKVKLPAKKLIGSLSSPYEFTVTNTGTKDFYVANVTTDRPIAYLNYSRATVKPGEQTRVGVLFSKALMEQHQVKQVALQITVDLAIGEGGVGSTPYADEQITINIE